MRAGGVIVSPTSRPHPAAARSLRSRRRGESGASPRTARGRRPPCRAKAPAARDDPSPAPRTGRANRTPTGGTLGSAHPSDSADRRERPAHTGGVVTSAAGRRTPRSPAPSPRTPRSHTALRPPAATPIRGRTRSRARQALSSRIRLSPGRGQHRAKGAVRHGAHDRLAHPGHRRGRRADVPYVVFDRRVRPVRRRASAPVPDPARSLTPDPGWPRHGATGDPPAARSGRDPAAGRYMKASQRLRGR